MTHNNGTELYSWYTIRIIKTKNTNISNSEADLIHAVLRMRIRLSGIVSKHCNLYAKLYSRNFKLVKRFNKAEALQF